MDFLMVVELVFLVVGRLVVAWGNPSVAMKVA